MNLVVGYLIVPLATAQTYLTITGSRNSKMALARHLAVLEPAGLLTLLENLI